jgi:hypothetical protein
LGGGFGVGFGWAGCGGACASDTDTTVTANSATMANAASTLLAVRAGADMIRSLISDPSLNPATYLGADLCGRPTPVSTPEKRQERDAR